MNDGWGWMGRRDQEGKERGRRGKMKRWQASTTGQSVLISTCNKESETLSPREDTVHLVSALTRCVCVC